MSADQTAATGTAGAYAALSQLWRLPGVAAAIFPDHTPGIDLVAVRAGVTKTIQVKSTSSELRRWRLPDKGHFPEVDLFILVEVHGPSMPDTFYVVPTKELAEATASSYGRWQQRHEGRDTETRFIGYDDPVSATFLD